MKGQLPKQLREAIAGVTAKRPRTVLDHILEHGRITTEELRDQYGYNHPPRAKRDVVEQGIPLRITRVRGSDGRSIAAYELDVEAAVQTGKGGGRRAIPKRIKQTLMDAAACTCAVCDTQYAATFLQADHRVPFEVAGEPGDGHIRTTYQLLCRACNRAKSWTCEHCANWSVRDPSVCTTCYWAQPEEYAHIAMSEERRIELVIRGRDVEWFDRLVLALRRRGISVQRFARESVRRSSGRQGSVPKEGR
ncbi:MAG: HNH endonuclease [Armatimonadetes bacterium]|nr:HNH endonuclease [Armatimonadota bacterium]